MRRNLLLLSVLMISQFASALEFEVYKGLSSVICSISEASGTISVHQSNDISAMKDISEIQAMRDTMIIRTTRRLEGFACETSEYSNDDRTSAGVSTECFPQVGSARGFCPLMKACQAVIFERFETDQAISVLRTDLNNGYGSPDLAKSEVLSQVRGYAWSRGCF